VSRVERVLLGRSKCSFQAAAHREVIGEAGYRERACDRAVLSRDDAKELTAFTCGSLGLEQYG
jgi:hypothetical protein